MADTTWMADASCRGKTALFFVDGPARRVQRTKRSNDLTCYADARAICGLCPVRQPCLDYALRERIGDGMYGGYSPRERRSMKVAS